MRAVPGFLYPAERPPEKGSREIKYFHEVLTMQLFVDLKICESCGSLWYRATGGVQVYCGSCAAKLGEFPVPRTRSQQGGRRKRTGAMGGMLKASTGGVR